MSRRPLLKRLPEFPWDSLADVIAIANAHPEGAVDLSIGTPVDDVAPGIQLALSTAAFAPGYPPTIGSEELRDTIADHVNRRYGAQVSRENTMAVIGTKEAIAMLPQHLGISGARVVIPPVAYPTYEVAALVSGNEPVRAQSCVDVEHAELVFINSPSNPTGRVMGVEELCSIVADARDHRTILASDECYISLGWENDREPVSILDERVNGGDLTGLLAIHSLSKSSNMASYRAGFLVGDPALIAELTTIRKHLGLMVPGPIQAAMIAALKDDNQEALQKLRYARRRATLLPALIDAGYTVDHSEAGLYLWVTCGNPARATLKELAEIGIIGAPGDFYGDNSHVRLSLTATDAAIDAAATRLRA